MVIPMAYLSILDGVRTVAVLLVVACHLLLHMNAQVEPSNYSFRTLGHLGVAIFFVHTTLVLMGSMQRHGSAPIPFYVRRIFRIYPLAVIIVLFFALLQLAIKQPIDVGKLGSNLFLVQNVMGYDSYYGPLWSLPYEVQMYLLLPILYAIITRTKTPVLWCAVLYLASVTAALADTANIDRFHVPHTTASLIRYAPCFTAGALAFALSGRIKQVLSPLWLATILAVSIGLAPWLVGTGASETPLLWAICLVIAVVIPATREITFRPLATAAKTVATYSYGVYLTHVFAFAAIEGLMPGPPVVRWAAMLILLAGLPYVCYHGIEKRGVALGARIAGRLERSSGDQTKYGTGGAPLA